jgi:hypothetical protein
VSNYVWRDLGMPRAEDDPVPLTDAYVVMLDPCAHEAVARLIGATEALLDLVQSNRLVLGEHVGPQYVAAITCAANEAIRGMREAR